MIGTYSLQEVFHWEQLAVLTNNVPQEIGALPHNVLRLRVACFDVFQPLLPNSFNRCPQSSEHQRLSFSSGLFSNRL